MRDSKAYIATACIEASMTLTAALHLQQPVAPYSITTCHKNSYILKFMIAGFTAWSSGVSPEVVFATLEIYFSLFDALALARALRAHR